MATKLAASIRLFARFAMVLILAAATSVAAAQLPFFPGAEGYGGSYLGSAPAAGWFSDATVYHVTTTQDYLGTDGKGAPGTLRGAFREKSANKIIVFDVGGTFNLTVDSLDIKNLQNYYVAGQTAPSPVTVYGDTTQITASSDKTNSNVILRYLTFRKGTGNGEDAITFANGGAAAPSTNMIIDHVSACWSEDEVLSVAGYNTNVTVQYTMMTDSLKSGHQYGSLIRPKIDSQVTYHHNLYGNDMSRNPRPGTYNGEELTLDFRNNVIYNWSDRAGYTGGASEDDIEHVNLNYVGNYAIAGPATPTGTKSTTIYTEDTSNDPLDVKVYQSGNKIDSDHDAVRDGTDTDWGMFAQWTGSTTLAFPTADRMGTAFATPAVTTQSADDAYSAVMDYVGNWWWDRDVIDQRIIGNVENNTQPVGGIPALVPVPSELAYVTSGAYPATPTTHPVGYDTDGDAMPDVWETAHGLNPNSGSDWNLDFDSDGYINLIEYINEAGAFPAPAPIVFNGTTNSRYAQITNWRTDDGGVTTGTNWQPSRFDEAQINSGSVVVDSVGQHAGVLKIGANAGDVASLSITDGWLDVADELAIGADDDATASLSLSGGVLNTTTLSKGAGGSMSFTGGTLHADQVGFSLTNQGGTLAPGQSIGMTMIDGDLTLASGTLEIELAAGGQVDSLFVDGLATLGGNLDVVLLDGFVPTSGSWEIMLTSGGYAGSFASITDGFSVQQHGDGLLLVFGSALSGDYNEDGVVDAADYSVWRDSYGQSGSGLAADGDDSGTVDEADYTIWKTHFGETAGAGSLAGTSAVPEPTSLMLLLMGCLWLVRRR